MLAPNPSVPSGIHLRPLRSEDAETSVTWRNDPATRDSLLSHRLPVSLEMERRWVAEAASDQSRARIVMAIGGDGPAPLGYVYLLGIDWLDRQAELAIVVGDASHRRHGVGRDACALMIGTAFDSLGLERVHVRVAAYNAPALALFRKLGFRDEGVMRRHIFRNGERHDLHIMGLLRQEWTSP